MERKSQKLVVILGPTSSGKTSLAIKLCHKYGGSILSVDSRQIYKYMDIGTGKTPVVGDHVVERTDEYWKIDEVAVFGYDLVTPSEFFSAYDYANYALRKINNIGENIFLVGGTGFFIDIVTGRVQPANVPPDFELRESLEKLSLEELQHKYVSALGDNTLIDRQNPARLIRAIEKAYAGSKKTAPLPYIEDKDYLHIGLTASRDYLYKKVDLWADLVWKNGLLEEVQNLHNSGFSDSSKLNGLVYREANFYLSGQLSSEEALQRMKYSLHAYIRRQQTYFKKIPNVNWIDVERDNSLEKVYNIING